MRALERRLLGRRDREAVGRVDGRPARSGVLRAIASRPSRPRAVVLDTEASLDLELERRLRSRMACSPGSVDDGVASVRPDRRSPIASDMAAAVARSRQEASTDVDGRQAGRPRITAVEGSSILDGRPA